MRWVRLVSSTSTKICRAPAFGLAVLAAASGASGQAPAAPRAAGAPPRAEVSAEAKPPADGPAASTPTRTTPQVDLSNRYRFQERHAREDGRELPGALGAYRVGLVEVIKDAVDQPQGAPRRAETTRQAVFLERATEQGGLAGVLGSVRFYEQYQARPEDPAKAMGVEPLDGLSVALRYRSAEWPVVAALTDRKPTDYEYEVATRQMAVAQLGLILPTVPVRVGDSWRIPRRGAQALLGDAGTRGDTLVGKLVELRREVDGPRSVAVMSISGRVQVAAGEAAVNAEALFTFRPEEPTAQGASGKVVEGLLEARGATTEIRLARTTSGPLPPPGRLRFQTTREVTMHRQLDLDAQAAVLPKLPPAPKLEDPAHWLTWLDPSRRFRLDHPQDFLPPERSPLAPVEPGAVVLFRARREGTDVLKAEYAAKALTPEDLKARLAAETGQMKLEVIRGEEDWLPEADWPGLKVYRAEAAVQVPAPLGTPSSRATRIHFDAYLIQPPRAAGLMAIATTSRDPVAPYRREVEQILRTIQFDPAAPAAP